MGSFLLLACSSDDDHTPLDTQPTKDIVETAGDNGNFTTLIAALEAAELDDDLAGPGPYTVSAPTDEAFALLPGGTIGFLLDPANQEALIDLLTYHVIDTVFGSGRLAIGQNCLARHALR
jgi:uncharacterized surface protein with fasciclin (FAS1) repeats